MKTQETLAEDRAFLLSTEQWINTREDYDLLVSYITQVDRHLRTVVEVVA